VIETPLAEEFAKIRSETRAACIAECERIAKDYYETHQAALLASIQIEHPEIKTLPSHYHDVKPGATFGAEACAEAIRALS